jgi:hypothetical protein
LQRHQIDVQEYCTRYLKNSAPASTGNSSSSPYAASVSLDKRTAVVKKRAAPPRAQIKPVPVPLVQEPLLAEPDLMGRVFSDDVEEMALVVCRICQLTMAPRKLLRHIRTDHDIDSKVKSNF